MKAMGFSAVVVASVLAFAGCAASAAPTDEEAPPADDTAAAGSSSAEADGSDFDRAIALELGRELTIAEEANRARFFTVVIPEGNDGTLSVKSVGTSSAMITRVAIYDSRLTELPSKTDKGVTSLAVTANHTYYVEVSSSAAAESYLVAATFTPVDDAFEPNDDTWSAATVASGQTVDVRLFAGHDTNGGSDADYFRIPTGGPNKQTLSIKLANGSKDDAQLFSADVLVGGTRFIGAAYSTAAGGDIEATFALPAGTEEVVVKLSANNSAKASRATFTVY